VIKEIKKPPDLKEGKRVKQFLDLVNQRRSQGQSVVSSGGADVDNARVANKQPA
jgi:hypothetical protein